MASSGPVDDRVKCLAIGDIHIKISNIQDIDLFLGKLEEHLKVNKYDFIVNLGDTLDTHEKLDSITLSKATDYFKLMLKYANTYVLVGNHDYISNQQFLSDKHWLNPFKMLENDSEEKEESGLDKPNKLKIVDTVIVDEYKGYDFMFVPYVTDGRFKEAIEHKMGIGYLSRENSAQFPSCIFAHQLFDTVKMGAIVAENVEKWNVPIQIISGHIHDRQTIPIFLSESSRCDAGKKGKESKEKKKGKEEVSKKTIYYTGSSLQHAFGESADKTILDATFDKDDIKMEEIDLQLPKRKIVRCEVSEIKKVVKKLPMEKIADGSLKIKIYVSGSYEDYKAFKETSYYREQTKLGIRFTFKGDPKDVAYRKTVEEKGTTYAKKDINFFKLLKDNIDKDENKEMTALYTELVMAVQPVQQDVDRDAEGV